MASVIACILCFLTGIVLALGAGSKLPVGKAWQREAILKGHAIWAVDKDGDPVFQWKPTGSEK